MTTITASFVRFFQAFAGGATDPTTGTFYWRSFHPSDSAVLVYSSAAAFESGSIGSTFNLQTHSIAGAYIGAYGGDLFGRAADSEPTSTDTAQGRWSASTGALELLGSPIATMQGNDYNGTFDGGAYSGPSTLQDATGLYVLGRQNSTTWQVIKENTDLTIAESHTFSAGTLGYAFTINGKLYLGDSYNSGHISRTYNFATN